MEISEFKFPSANEANKTMAHSIFARVSPIVLVTLAAFTAGTFLSAESPRSPRTVVSKRKPKTDLPSSDVASDESRTQTKSPKLEPQLTENSQIDFAGFVSLTKNLEPVREQRRVPLEAFLKKSKEKGTVILDTRSKAAFDEVHVKGAIHLNFSDFTEKKLAEVIPDKNTQVLIYCNNNFLKNKLRSLMLKSAPLALNIPTFINLHGYGYENVYELADTVSIKDTRLPLEGTAAELVALRGFHGC